MKTLSTFALAMLLAACGQSGPLRLPDPKQTPPTVPSPGSKIPAAESKIAPKP